MILLLLAGVLCAVGAKQHFSSRSTPSSLGSSSFLRCIEAQEWKNIFSSFASSPRTLDNRNEFNRKARISSAGGRERGWSEWYERASQEKHIYDVQMILKSVCGNSRLVSLSLLSDARVYLFADCRVHSGV